MKEKFTLPNILFGIFTIIVIGLGVRKYLQNQEAIDKWDRDNAEVMDEIRKHYDSLKQK